jgi:hypothetical protein
VATQSIAKRVAQGAALLDKKRPNWWREIDVDSLDIQSTCGCVLGQLGRTAFPMAQHPYDGGLFLVGLPSYHSRAYGFDVSSDADEAATIDEEDRLARNEYTALTAEWKRVIEARRATA